MTHRAVGRRGSHALPRTSALSATVVGAPRLPAGYFTQTKRDRGVNLRGNRSRNHTESSRIIILRQYQGCEFPGPTEGREITNRSRRRSPGNRRRPFNSARLLIDLSCLFFFSNTFFRHIFGFPDYSFPRLFGRKTGLRFQYR